MLRRWILVGIALTHCAGTGWSDDKLDRYLHPLPKGAIARLGMRADTSNATTHCASAESSDGALLATAVEGYVVVWDLKTGRVLQNFKSHPYTIRGLAFLGKDTLLVQGRGNKWKDEVIAYNARTAKLLRSFEVHENWAGTAFSHDGKLLALTTTGDPNILRVWDTEAGKELYSDREHYPFLFFSQDDRFIISSRQNRIKFGVYDTIVTFRDARTGNVARKVELKDKQSTITDVSPDGKFLVGYTFINHEMQKNWRTRLQLFNAETGELVRTFLEQRSGDLKSAVISPDGKYVSGVDHNEREMALWEVETGKRVGTFTNQRNFFNYPRFSRDGKTLFNTTSTGRVFAYDPRTGAVRDLNPTHGTYLTSLAFTPDGKHLASSGYMSELFLWNVADATLQQRMDVPTLLKKKDENHWDYAMKMAFAPDGKHLLFQQQDQRVRLFNPFRGREVTAFREAGHVWGFSEDGKDLLWTGIPVDLIMHMRHTPKRVTGEEPLAVANTLRWAAYAYWYPELRQFKPRAYVTPDLKEPPPPKAQRFLMEASGSAIAPQSLSPDGSVMVETLSVLTGNPFSGMGTYWVPAGMRFTDASTGQEIARIDAARGSDFALVRFSPDSRSFIGQSYAPDRTAKLKLYELRTGKARQVIGSPLNQYGANAFSRDGRLFAFVSEPTTIEVFDLARCKIVATFKPPPTDLHGHLTFSPDGKLLASGGRYGTILLWDVSNLEKEDPAEPAWSDDDRDRIWNDLAADPEKAFAAMMRLKRRPADAVAFFRDRLLKRSPNEDIAKLIDRLGSDDFVIRKKASDALEQLGERVRPMLGKALVKPASLEHRRRIETLIEQLGKPFSTPVGLRMLRAIEVLDALRTPEAATLLRELSADAPLDDPVAREISRALARIERTKQQER